MIVRIHSLKRSVLAGTTLVLCVWTGSIWNCAHAKEPWQRVYTGDDSVIELNTATARFGPGNLLRVEFRTVLSKAESIAGQGNAKYKTRLEKIDFRLTDRRYRFIEISLLDSSGKTIQTKTTDASEEWRLVKPGGITERLYDAAAALTPLGAWQVISYRFAESGPKIKSTPELDRLVGVRVRLHVSLAQVGEKVCSSPSFQDKDATHDDSLRQLGIDWKSIGVRPEDARTINVRCEVSGWRPSQSLLVKDNNKEEMLMLWEGVFLVLKRTDGAGGVGLPSLRRRP
jgi:hypothetical protein